MDRKTQERIASLDLERRVAEFDHDSYEDQWAQAHPIKYHFGSLDAIIANGEAPEDWVYPRVRMVISIVTIVVLSILMGINAMG